MTESISVKVLSFLASQLECVVAIEWTREASIPDCFLKEHWEWRTLVIKSRKMGFPVNERTLPHTVQGPVLLTHDKGAGRLWGRGNTSLTKSQCRLWLRATTLVWRTQQDLCHCASSQISLLCAPIRHHGGRGNRGLHYVVNSGIWLLLR